MSLSLSMNDSQRELSSRLVHLVIKQENGKEFDRVTADEIFEFFSLDEPVGVLILKPTEFAIEFSSSENISDLTSRVSELATWRDQPATIRSLVPSSTFVKFYERSKLGDIPEHNVVIPGKPPSKLSEEDVMTWAKEIKSLSIDQLKRFASLIGEEVGARRNPLEPEIVVSNKPDDPLEEEILHSTFHSRPKKPSHDASPVTKEVSFLQNLSQCGTLRTSVPIVHTFSGDTATKGDVSFEQWHYEVESLLGVYNDSTIKEVINRSLKGAAADTVRVLGPKASVEQILEEMSIIFGTVSSFDVMKQQLYSMVQGESESVSLFATRMKSLLSKIMETWPGKMRPSEVAGVQKDRLFHGVKKHIRDSIRHQYDSPASTYASLVIAARKAEGELQTVDKEEAKPEKEKTKAKSASATVPSSETATLQNLKELLEKQQQQLNNLSRGRGRGRGFRGRGNGRGRGRGNHRGFFNGGRGYRGNGRGNFRGRGGNQRGGANGSGFDNSQADQGQQQAQEETTNQDNLQCYNCFQWGHIQYNCPQLNQTGPPQGSV